MKKTMKIKRKMIRTMTMTTEEEVYLNLYSKILKDGFLEGDNLHKPMSLGNIFHDNKKKILIYYYVSLITIFQFKIFLFFHIQLLRFFMLKSSTKIIQRLTSKKKPEIDNPSFKQKLQIINQLKPYFIPFLHKNKLITKSLLKSYAYLAMSKFCFFGGPMLLKQGINSLHSLTLMDPLSMFLGYGICYSCSILFQSFRNVEVLKVTSLALSQTSSKAYKHMLQLGPQFFFSGSQRTKLFNMYKAQSAIENNIKSFTQYFLPFFLDVGICSTFLLYYADYTTMIAFLTCYSVYSIFTIKYSQYRRKHIRQQRMSERKLDFISSETFANYYNVKYFKKQNFQVQKYQKALENYYANAMKAQKSLGILNTVQRVIFGVGVTFNLMIGAYFVQKGLMSTGDVIMIQTLMLQFLNPLFFLGSSYRNFMDTFVQVRELFDTMNKPAEVIQGNKQLSNIQGQISFNNVTFVYSPGASVIENLSFKIQPGSFVGIIGESGSGKSTILNLIFRLYDPQSGSITLDGQNIRDLSFSYRDSIVFVSQSPYLFNGTVMQNLQYGNMESKKEQIEYYTKALGIHDVIMQLPKKYESNVGEKGNIFSGGQKQRISLIRALLKKSPIILLDQPTSALDYQSQEKVIKLLKQNKSTKIMITHRESLLKYVDQVIQIKKI